MLYDTNLVIYEGNISSIIAYHHDITMLEPNALIIFFQERIESQVGIRENHAFVRNISLTDTAHFQFTASLITG